MRRKLVIPIIFGILTTGLALGYDWKASNWPLVKTTRLKLVDSLYRYRNRNSSPSPSMAQIVIVGLDDQSDWALKRRWPWGRDVFAAFFQEINKLNPKNIALDFALIGRSLEKEVDKRLAGTMGLKRNTILASYFDAEGVLIQPLKLFREEALCQGFIDRKLDLDAVSRRSTFVEPLENGGVMPSFALATAAAYLNQYSGPKDSSFLELVPKDMRRNAWSSLRYSSAQFRTISFWHVLTGKVNPKEIEGKIVMVGATSSFFKDIHMTPFGHMAGIHINANDVVSILDQDFVREILNTNRWIYFLLLSVGLILLVHWMYSVYQLLVLVGAEAGVYISTLILFSRMNILVEPFSPMFILAVSYAMVMFYKVVRTFIENLALQHQVITDALTGLFVHRYLLVKLAKVFKESAENNREFCVVMLDADHFKKVNDTYGHDQGNEVLVEISKTIKRHIRRHDVAARFGGEEFTVILMDTNMNGAYECIERMRKAIENIQYSHSKGAFQVTVSAGVASNHHPQAGHSEDILKLADAQLYRAKNQGRNCTCFADAAHA